MKNVHRWLIALVLLAGGCNKDKGDTPTPEPKLELGTALAGKYWSSNSFFIYFKDGKEIVDTQTSLPGLRYEMELPSDPDLFLGVFRCNEACTSVDTYSISPYEGNSKEQELLVSKGLYSLFLNPDTNVVRLTANDPHVAEKNIYEGMSLRLRSLAEDRIEFDMDLNDFVRNEWAPVFENSPSTITGIRVVWRALTEQERTEYKNFLNPIVVFPQ